MRRGVPRRTGRCGTGLQPLSRCASCVCVCFCGRECVSQLAYSHGACYRPPRSSFTSFWVIVSSVFRAPLLYTLRTTFFSNKEAARQRMYNRTRIQAQNGHPEGATLWRLLPSLLVVATLLPVPPLSSISTSSSLKDVSPCPLAPCGIFDRNPPNQKAMAVLFHLNGTPEALGAAVVRRIAADALSAEEVSPHALSRLCFVLGHLALKLLVYAEVRT